MENAVSVYPVAGGWQASDSSIHMAAFGRTEGEARTKLAETQRLSRELDDLVANERRAKAH